MLPSYVSVYGPVVCFELGVLKEAFFLQTENTVKLVRAALPKPIGKRLDNLAST